MATVVVMGAGIGAGVYTGVAVATIGGHSRPAFAFGMELFAFAGSQGAELMLLPYLTIEGIYITLIATFAVGLLFISWLPRRPVDKALITHAHSDHARPGHGAITGPAANRVQDPAGAARPGASGNP